MFKKSEVKFHATLVMALLYSNDIILYFIINVAFLAGAVVTGGTAMIISDVKYDKALEETAHVIEEKVEHDI